MSLPETYYERLQRLRTLAIQLNDLKAKYAEVTNPAYTELSPTGVLLLRSAINALEAILTALATSPVAERKEPTDA